MKSFLRKYGVTVIGVALFLCVVIVVPAIAQNTYGLENTGKAAGFNKATDGDAYGLVGKVISIALGMLGFVFFGYTLYAGFRWMIARGNNEFVEKAQRTLETSVIGLVIVVLSYALATFILSRIAA